MGPGSELCLSSRWLLEVRGCTMEYLGMLHRASARFRTRVKFKSASNKFPTWIYDHDMLGVLLWAECSTMHHMNVAI